MSFAKYAQFYRDNGFFAGSKIKAKITDNSFIGQEMVLSKGNAVLQTRVIPVTGIAEFFTDANGELTLSSDNGDSQISATVEVSAYGTYDVTVSGTVTANARYTYATKTEVDLGMETTSDSVKIAYTGDTSAITATSSDSSIATASVKNNVVTINRASGETEGSCTVKATVAATTDYKAKTVNISVKRGGSIGSWATASDEVIAKMIARADAGEIDLADYWNIGDTRRVHLNAIAAGTETAMQNEQDIDLVIMHNPLGDEKYTLATPTVGNRYQPHFIIGTKDCLEGKTNMGYLSKTISAKESTTTSYSSYMPTDENNVSALLEMLNDTFIKALPQYIQDALKATERMYINTDGKQNQKARYGYSTWTVKGTISHKVSIMNIKELGLSSAVTRPSGRNKLPTGVGVYNSSGIDGYDNYTTAADVANNAINSCGTKFSYFDDKSIVMKKGINGANTDYLLSDGFMYVNSYSTTSYGNGWFSVAFYIDSNGNLMTNDLSNAGQRTALRGVAPIMFI